MQRINSANMAAGNKFQDAKPGTGQLATSLNAEWYNGVQEELIGLLVAAGITPQSGLYTQVLAAIKLLIAAGTVNPFLVHASAATCDLGAAVGGATSTNAQVSGTTNISSFGNSASTNYPVYYVRFSNALTLLYGAALLTPGNRNINVVGGDAVIAVYLGGGNWQVLHYFPAAGSTYGSNGNGNWMTRADGRLDQDGVSPPLPTGANTASIGVTFPVPFTGANPPVITASPDNDPDGSHTGMGWETIIAGAPGNWTGATFKVATLDISINFTNTVHMMWNGRG
jgi:hypothetical protein